MKLVIASNNKHKIDEIKSILGGKFDEIVSMKEAGLDIDPEETGLTFAENSLIKAKACYDILHEACLADDSGLTVKALGGAPGVFSARYAGEHANDAKNNEKLLFELNGNEERSAAYVTVITLIKKDGEVVTAEGRHEGRILTEPHGYNGFGYDPLFWSSELKKTFADASPEEKNSVSHRGKALRALLEKL